MGACFPLISREEYLSRLGAVRAQMAERSIDLLVLTGKANLRYFAGYDPGAWVMPNYYYILLLPRDAAVEPVLLLAEPYQAGAQMSWVADVRFWPLGRASFMAETSPAIDLIRSAIQDMGLSRGTIGFELGSHLHPHMGHVHVARLIESLPDARIVDGTDAVLATRMIKSAFEIELLARACDITERAVIAGFEKTRTGVTEREIAAVMGSTALTLGATSLDFLALYTYPARACWSNCPPVDYAVQAGDVVHFDGGFAVEGYQCDIMRQAALGEPTKAERRCYEVNRESVEAGVDAVRPGIPAREVYEAVARVKRRAGFGAFVDWCEANGMAAVGHGIGLDLHEPPGLSKYNETILRPGMVLCVEHALSLDGATPSWTATYRSGIEAQVLVTETGAQVLSCRYISHDMWVVGNS